MVQLCILNQWFRMCQCSRDVNYYGVQRPNLNLLNSGSRTKLVFWPKPGAWGWDVRQSMGSPA